MTRLKGWQRQALAARGLDPSKNGVAYNATQTQPWDGPIPTEPGELENLLKDQEQVQGWIKSGKFGDLIKNYARAVNEADKSILGQVKEQVQATMAEWLKDNPGTGDVKRLNLDPYNGPGAAKPHKYNNPRAIGASANGMFDCAADFFQAAWHKGSKSQDVRAKLDQLDVANSFSEKIPGDGGFLVPEEFRSEILRVSLESAIVRPRARVIPMAGGKLHFPMIDQSSHVSSVYGGVVAYWTEEGGELTESQTAFGSVKLEPWKLTALAHVPNELVADWGAFGVFFDEIFPEAVSFYEDLAFINGTGAGQPAGALNTTANSAIVAVTKESGQTADTIVWANVIKMYARMLPSSINRAVWVASPDTFVELATMALEVGTGGSAVWITDGHSAPQLTLLGRPIIMTEKAPQELGDQGDLSFVDFGMYLIGDRQAMTVDSSAHVKFTSDKTTFRVIQRVDGRPWLQSAITPANNSPSLTGFVQLASRT